MITLKDIEQLGKEIKENQQEISNETETIEHCIKPLMALLNYKKPTEIKYEYPCFILRGQSEKVDIALMNNGNPIILVECKQINRSLTMDDILQLKRYFDNQPSVKLGILTNGIKYWFFMDFENINLMDSKPFYTYDISKPSVGHELIISLDNNSDFSFDNIRKLAEKDVLPKKGINFINDDNLLSEILSSVKITCEYKGDTEDGKYADAMFRFSGKYSGTIRLSVAQLSDPKVFKKALTTFVPDSFTSYPLTDIITQTSNSRLIIDTLNSLIRYMKELYGKCELFISVRPGIGDVTMLADRSINSEELMGVKDFSIWNGGNKVLMTYWKDDKYQHIQAIFNEYISEFPYKQFKITNSNKQFKITNSNKQLSAGFGTYPEELEKGIANLIKFYQFTGGMMAAWAIVASYYKDLMQKEIKIPPIYLYGVTQAEIISCARVIHAMFGLYSFFASKEFTCSGISDATTVYIDSLFGDNEGLHGIPVILDEGDKNSNYKNTSEIQKIILAIYNGTGKGQGTRSQSGTHKTTYSTTAIIAGIDLPEQSEALNRCFFVNMDRVSKHNNHEFEETFKDTLKQLSAFIFTARKTISSKHLIQRFHEIWESVYHEMQRLGITNRETSSIALIRAGYELLVEHNLIPKDTVPTQAWYDQIGNIKARAKDIDTSEQLLRMVKDVAGQKIGFLDFTEYITFSDFADLVRPYYRVTIKTTKDGEGRVAFKMLAEYYRQETQKPMNAIQAYQHLLNHRLLKRNSKGEETYTCNFYKENSIVRGELKERYSIKDDIYVAGKNYRCMVFEIPYEAVER